MTVIPAVVTQHLDDAAASRAVRSLLVRAPHIRLQHLARSDERLAAHLDGLSLSGDFGVQLSQSALEVPGVGQIFVAAVLAIERRDQPVIERLVSLLDAVPASARALASAFGWVSASSLRGLAAPLLNAPSPTLRWLGIAACAQHRVDPGAPLTAAIDQTHPGLRARALQAAGELGRVDLLEACMQHLQDEHVACKTAAAWSAALLGDRGPAVAALRSLATEPGPAQMDALALSIFSADSSSARSLVKQLAAQKAPLRTMIKAAGWAGDPQVLPWLLKQMEDDQHARLAAEAFSFITGADLADLELERMPRPVAATGPNDNPEDPDVALDEDENLPWPDVPRLKAWWQQHADRFNGEGRFLAGAAVSPSHCIQVLRQQTQRSRRAAAFHLRLMTPASTLFNCAAPARRQRQLLSQMEG